MTEEQKKKAAERLKQAREAKKTKEEVTVEEKELTPEETVKKAISDSDLVEFILPLEPWNPNPNQYYDRSINGVFFRVKRGERTMLPRYIVDFIESREAIQRTGMVEVREYLDANRQI